MTIKVGEVEALFRYPVKSMSGEALEEAELGWHGLGGDRRLAFRRIDDRRGFPWLTATKLPDLLLFTPVRRGAGTAGGLPTHVRTPGGEELALFGQELAAEVGRRHGSPVDVDPDLGLRTPEMLKAVVRERDNKAGVYGTVIRRGRLAVGQPLYLTPTTENREHG